MKYLRKEFELYVLSSDVPVFYPRHSLSPTQIREISLLFKCKGDQRESNHDRSGDEKTNDPYAIFLSVRLYVAVRDLKLLRSIEYILRTNQQ